jgi:hypothetical protein
MKRMKLFICLAAVLIALFFYGWTQFNRSQKDTAKLQSDFRLTADELVASFQKNEVLAGKTYNDKVLSVTGTISLVSKEEGRVNVSIGGVLCQFSKNHAADATGLIAGQQIRIRGICTGLLLDVVLVNCVLDNEK